MGQQVSMAKTAEEGWPGMVAEMRVAWRLSGLEEDFPGMSAEQAAADRLYRKGSHEECVLETQAFLGTLLQRYNQPLSLFRVRFAISA